ncbi:MAG: phosphotransferase [Bacteroidales bacterium]|nr:phosphotransferase [Bacteroidales bacterium]
MEEIKKLFEQTFSQKIVSIEKMQASGSNRQYFRCKSEAYNCIGAYNPNTEENIAFIDYARQLKQNGIDVPEIYSYSDDFRFYLQQDLGDETFFTYLKHSSADDVLNTGRKIMKSLVSIHTMPDFNYSKAFPIGVFDKQAMMWDLNYFKYYFLKLAEIEFNEQKLQRDFDCLTDYLQDCVNTGFMYRDFIPRNIMIVNSEPYFIDFQGGRKGAMQYDLASFLFDAKSDFSQSTREDWLDTYIKELNKQNDIDEVQFKEYFYAYVYIRIMQTMGAYGYRGFFERKIPFLKSIPFAIKNLTYLMQNYPLKISLPQLNGCFEQILASDRLKSVVNQGKLTVNIKSFSYKKGYPQDTSGNGGGFVFDCRALPNPGREARFKNLTGKDKEVKDYLEKQESVKYFLQNVFNILNQTTENYLSRNFTSLCVYFGCTGGQHRSVYCAEKYAEYLSQNTDLNIIVNHTEQNI